ncbi:MAG: 16S rRNA (cytidine(1402)-2'-O)-methyltransferase [Clostridia bacterium]|nr:16S rRNA (cytidine(1402)-2'-O)-methyltransferase [Clostridia bacterium]
MEGRTGKNAVTPALYLCATPIGNLDDITLRVVNALRAVDVVYAEDTRNTARLLRHLGIEKPLLSCHEHNEAKRAEEIAAKVEQGMAVAFVSDAGMPGISDPGEKLVRACVERAVPYFVLPGPSAAVTAHVVANFGGQYRFVGFLPRASGARAKLFEVLAGCDCALVLYESPLRLSKTAGELARALGNRRAVLVRELTKLHESAVRATLAELSELYAQTPPKGECVLVVEGRSAELPNETDASELIAQLLRSGHSAKDAAREASERTGVPRNAAYAMALQLLRGAE